MIELTHASFQYENSDRGVQDISILVKSGEFVVLTGLSGCGKTTVTRLVNGLAPSYYPGVFSGSVRIDDKDISRLSTCNKAFLFSLYSSLSFFQWRINDSSDKNKANHLQDDRNDPGYRIGNKQNLQ